MSYILMCLIYALPVGMIVFFAVSLVLYLSAKHRSRVVPGSVSPEKLKVRKVLLIVSAVIAGALVLAVLALIALLFTAVAFM